MPIRQPDIAQSFQPAAQTACCHQHKGHEKGPDAPRSVPKRPVDYRKAEQENKHGKKAVGKIQPFSRRNQHLRKADHSRQSNCGRYEFFLSFTHTHFHFPQSVRRPLLFPRATSQVAMLAWIFGDCREGQIPRCSAALQV